MSRYSFEITEETIMLRDHDEKLIMPVTLEQIAILLNVQDKEIKQLKCINRQLEERLDRSIALDMSRCGKYIYGIHGGSNDK